MNVRNLFGHCLENIAIYSRLMAYCLNFYSQALAQLRMSSLMQLSRALNDARLEKEAAVAQAVANAKAEKMEAAADERQEQLIKVLVK